MEQTIPEDLWRRIEQCKSQCTIEQLKEMLDQITNIANNNIETLNKLQKDIEEEENEDQNTREKFNENINMPISEEANFNIKKQLTCKLLCYKYDLQKC